MSNSIIYSFFLCPFDSPKRSVSAAIYAKIICVCVYVALQPESFTSHSIDQYGQHIYAKYLETEYRLKLEVKI